MSTTVTYKGETLTTAQNQTKTLLTNGKIMEGDLTITDSTLLKNFVIRPDAELLQTYSYDKWIHEDEGITIPAYTTSDTTLKASASLSPTLSFNYDDYDYRILQRFLATPIYADGTAVAIGRVEYWLGCYVYDLVEIPKNLFIAANGTKYGSRTSGHYQCGQFYRECYWSSATALTAYATAAYGPVMAPTSPAISSTTETIKSPSLKIRGHSTYFRSARWAELSDIRYQYVIDVYRVPKDSLNVQAFESRQQALHIIDCVNNNNGKLT